MKRLFSTAMASARSGRSSRWLANLALWFVLTLAIAQAVHWAWMAGTPRAEGLAVSASSTTGVEPHFGPLRVSPADDMGQPADHPMPAERCWVLHVTPVLSSALWHLPPLALDASLPLLAGFLVLVVGGRLLAPAPRPPTAQERRVLLQSFLI